MEILGMNPLVAQALAAGNLTQGAAANAVAANYARIYAGKAGGNNHLVSLERDATRQGEAPSGMPVATLNLANGLVKPRKVRIEIDTTGQYNPTAGQELITIKLFDLVGYFAASPTSMAASAIVTTPRITLNGTVARMTAFMTRFYGQVIHAANMKIKVKNTYPGATCDACAFPEQFDHNITVVKSNEEQNSESFIWLDDIENPDSYKGNLGFVPLTDQQSRLDRETAWVWNVLTGQKITLTFNFVAYEHNS